MNGNKKTVFIDVEPGEEVVISGVAGRFPETDNVKQLQENLFNKVDLGTTDDRRWKQGHPDIPHRFGKVNDIHKFDAEYFDIPFNHAELMDPSSRMVLEHAYEAIVDAGINPKDLRGTKTGVFVGVCYSETEKIWFYEKLQVAGYGMLGCSKSMIANRISYWLGVTGPSCVIDTACSSTLFAIEHAYRSILAGNCHAAIVAGANLCLDPCISLQFARLGVLSTDGVCRPFDDDASGYMRSETIAAVFLQRAKNARRIYATVVYAKTNCDGYKEQGITFPSTEMQKKLLEEFYNECGISPYCMTYMEAHGTGTKVGDPEEINAIEKVFCKDRQIPLLIGSVKSNLGHSEPVSGLCQIIKVIIAMETGVIPPNVNFVRERQGVNAFEKNLMRVVTDPTPWSPTFVGINSFGFGGANCHILLRPNLKQKINKGAPNDDLPRLVVISGRTEQAIESFLRDIKNQPMDVEYIRLLHDLYAEDIKYHPYRGYIIFESNLSEDAIEEIQCYSGARKPICFVFSGMGSQWFGMGEALMRLPVFSKTVEKCHMILKTRGMRIVDILTNKSEYIFGNILNSIVGIVVMQIGLVDLLASVNIVPDHIIGHSIGELCCAYASGNITFEQAILSAYYIGLALSETKIVHGAMADIGLGYGSVRNICPPNIDVICIKSPNICSIGGPRDSVEAFITKLQVDKIFTEEINCGNVPLHSRYLAHAKCKILTYLNRIIPQTMTHGQIWHRASFHDAGLSYAEYFVNYLLSPANFEEVAKSMPENALAVEIAPDGISQDVMKELSDATNIVLVRRDHEDNVKTLLRGLGKMYNNGAQPQLASLYPTVQYPVGRGTPMISPSIKWNHFDNWFIPNCLLQKKIDCGERVVDIPLYDEDYEYMSGHIIDGRNLFPATGYLILAWETLAMLMGQSYKETSVVFENVKFLRATHFPKQRNVVLTIMVQKKSGNFEIIESGNAVVSGSIRVILDPAKEKVPVEFLQEDNNEEEVMKTKDIYKELRLRGYQYSGLFRGLKSSSITGKRGHITWMNNWVTFMDNMLQIKILGMDMKSLFVPTGITKLVIDVFLHARLAPNIGSTEDLQIPVRVYENLDVVKSGGVEIHGIKATPIFRRKTTGSPVLEEYKFVAHRDEAEVSLQQGIILSTHIVLEFHQTTKVNIIEIVENSDEVTIEELTSPLFLQILGNLPLLQPNITLITSPDRFDGLPPKVTVLQSKKLSKDDNAILIAGFDLLTKEKGETLRELLPALKNGGFLLTRGKSLTKSDLTNADRYNLGVVLEKRTEKEHITLLKERGMSARKTEVIHVNNYEFSWLDRLKSILTEEREVYNTTKIIVVGEKDSECGLLGLVNCLRREPGGDSIRGVFVQDETAPEFSLREPLYADQLQLDLAINVLSPGKIWGSYRHLPLPPLKPKPVYHAFSNQLIRGDLSSLCWIEGNIPPDSQDKDIIRIVYTSLNFKDVMVATGKIIMDSFMSLGRREECFIGLEYTGIDSAGCRVMGICENRCLSNLRKADRNICWEIPDSWSLEDAATVACAYGTCYYGFYLSEYLKKSDKILIHSGSGAVGQAAIYIALFEGCEIFTTVGTPEKRKFIRDTFPSIPDDHIGNSRDTSFEDMIIRQTGGRGVDVVLNSLAEEKLQASIRCLAKGGRFLEIGKFDFMSDNKLDLSIFSKGIKFYSVMLDNLFSAPEEGRKHLKSILLTGLENGAIKPISRKVFQQDEVEAAFRYMAAGKHIGKIIIKMRNSEESMDAPILALPRYYCLPNKTYIILGGLGGFGLELADWLVIRGAKNLVLISRAGIKNGYQQLRTEQWKSYGTRVVIISNVDASNVEDCEHILRSAEKLAPVDAIFNLAVALNDKICQNHTTETFEEPFKAKAWATKHLDQLSRKICPHLRRFVVFSSVSCGRGNPGQTNYGMANSVMERICERRVREGLHGLAIQWGAIGDVGLVADMQDNDKEMVIGGTLQQKIQSCIEKLEEFLLQEQPVVASMVLAEKRADGFSEMSVAETVAHIMGLKDSSTVARHTPLSELGMDSMMAVEIKQTLERDFDIFLAPQDIRTLNFAKLDEMFDTRNENLSSKYIQDPNELTGIKLMVRVIGQEHLVPDICMDLSTRRNETMTEIFLLPGIEGCGSIFEPLVQRIEAPAVCLQYGVYNIGLDNVTIKEIADRLLENILDRVKSRRDFVIVAYSFGSVVAVELVHKLEAMNLEGRLVLIDGSPEQMKAMAQQHIPFSTFDELQNNILVGIMDSLQPMISGKLLLELNECTDWNEKLEKFMSHFISPTYNKFQLSMENRKSLCATMYKHMIALHQYDLEQLPKIKSPVILLKPTVQSIIFPEEDYGLHKITTGNIEIHYIEGNHVTMLDSDKVVAAINGERIAKKLQPNSTDDDKIITIEDDRTDLKNTYFSRQ